jgi:hypothetical protein
MTKAETAPNLSSLLLRVEGATGADRHIDADIFWRFDERASGVIFSNYATGLPRALDHGRPIPSGLGRMAVEIGAPAYSASLDAALALCERVLPGWRWVVYGPDMDVRPHAWVSADNFRDDEGQALGSTPALALVAAMLKALIAAKQGRAA